MTNTTNQQKKDNNFQQKRTIRVFVSSTFRDMMEERDALMTHTWPQLRSFCRERHVEMVEVDLRWGIAEEQSTRKETLKLCLDEIRACRPFFIGLLGERYGWVPGNDAFSNDLKDEQPWLREQQGKSVTELEILHGVLNNPEMAGRAFFYFRDPALAPERGTDFLPEDEAAAEKQTALKNLIRTTCAEKNIPLHESYSDSGTLATLVLEQLKDAIETQFPKAEVPNQLDREALDHEAFAEMRRRIYIGRPDYFEALNQHTRSLGKPLVLLGSSGSGKSALLANWIAQHRQTHPEDFIFQHYIGGTPDSAIHWKLMTRLMAEIKLWTDDPNEIPRTNDDILRDFPLWLSKAKIKAELDGVRFIIVLDALNQLEGKDHGKLLGWLPEHPFTGTLRLIVSTLSGEAENILTNRDWQTLHIQPLTIDERNTMAANYLRRYSKKLDTHRLNRITNEPATNNPLYLRILLDELRVTGIHDNLDERLEEYLAAKDIPKLLSTVLTRYQRDYEHDRKGLVKEALGLIWAARRGLAEAELLQLLGPEDLPQLPLAIWAPLRAAIEDSLVDRGGILNFAHDFMRKAVEIAFLPDHVTKNKIRISLADYFESQPANTRNCDELPWLLWQAELVGRLRYCILNIDRFIEIRNRDESELRSYWVYLNEERTMGKSYLDSFQVWHKQSETRHKRISKAANSLGFFLFNSALHKEAESLYKLSLKINEENLEKDDLEVAIILNNLAELFRVTNRLREAEPLYLRALEINEKHFGKSHPMVAVTLNNLAIFLKDQDRIPEAEAMMKRALHIDEELFGKNHPRVATHLNNLALFALILKDKAHLEKAEPLMRRALEIDEKYFGNNHPNVARDLNNLAQLLKATNRNLEAKPLMIRALEIDEESFGENHTSVSKDLNNLALLLVTFNRHSEAEPLMKRALEIDEKSLGENHPVVAIRLGSLANLYRDTDRLREAELLYLRALKIDEKHFGKDHIRIATNLSNLALLLQTTKRLKEAEHLMIRAIQIFEKKMNKNQLEFAIILSNLAELYRITNRLREAEPLYLRALNIKEKKLGQSHPELVTVLGNFALLLQSSNRLGEAEILSRRMIEILINFTRTTGQQHPDMETAKYNYIDLLLTMGWNKRRIRKQLKKIAPEFLNK